MRYNSLLDNTEIVSGKIDIKKFLEGKRSMIAICDDRDYYTVFYKNSLTDNIILIDIENYCRKPFFNPYNRKDPKMIYNVKTNTLYIDDNRYENIINLEGLKFMTMKDLRIDIEEGINNKIIKIIDNNIDNLNLSTEELNKYDENILKDNKDYKYYKRDAIDHFIYGKGVKGNYARFRFNQESYTRYQDGFRKVYVSFEGLNIITMINDREYFINEQVEIIINEFKECIYESIVRNNKILEFIKEIEKDEKYINAKKVIAAMSDRSMKTLNIEYKKYDKTMKFKIEGGTHISSNTEGFYISNYRICNNSDRELFKKTFNNNDKYGEDIYLQNIESITYGRKVLYKK